MHLGDKSQAKRIILSQLAMTLIAALALLFVGWITAYSGFVGGIIATIANGVFAFKVFAPYQAQKPGKLLARFYSGELLKLAVTGLLFAAAVLWVEPLSIGAVVGVYLFVAIVPMFISHFFVY
ncbi:MAG: ATP synthase subunit I [Chromatiales bacterium]|nr:ATP synthase subunit I [Chromatiales bacterium]